MPEAERQLRLLRFGIFEVDLRAGELRKSGVKLKIGGQPFQVLTVLLERPGEVVTREELQKKLWPDTFVDVDHNLNTAINKICEVLGDSAESPRFVETLPRRGYRFIAPVDGEIASPPHSPDKLAATVAPTASEKRQKPVYNGLVAICVILLAVGALAIWTAFRTPRVPKVVRFTKLTNDGVAKDGPLATDGSRIFFNETFPDASNRIFQVSVEGGESVPLSVPLKQPRLLDLSKAGNELLVANEIEENSSFWLQPGSSSFWLQPGSGGSPRRIGTVRGDFAGFGAEGRSIMVGKKDEIDSVSADGSSRKLITVHGFPFHLRISPDTRVLRFTLFSPDNDTMELMEARPDGTALHKMFGGCCGDWTPDGRFFLFQDRRSGRLDSLWSMAEGRTSWWRKRENKPTQLTSGPLDFQFSLPSKDGKRIFSIGTTRRAEVVRYDPHIREFIPYLPGISVETLAFSQDGKWVAYTSYPGGNLWRCKVDGSERLQLTFPPLRAFLPRWSPDGKQIAFHAKPLDTPWNIYLVSSEGGSPERILPSGENQMDVNWSPDGNSLVFGHAMPLNKPIHTMDLRSKRVSTLPGSIGLFSPHWSPDGRYIAALKLRRSDTLELFDFVTQKWTEAWKTPPGSFMGYENWSRDGKYIFFQNWSSQDSYRILRFRLRDQKIEEIANLKGIRRLNNPWYAATWLGIAPDDSPLLSRDISTQEVYALDIEWP